MATTQSAKGGPKTGAKAPAKGGAAGVKTGKPAAAAAPASDNLDITDSRTGTSYSIPILEPGTEGDTTVRAMDLRQIKVQEDEFGLMTYDPAFMNTASCKSAITFIDGDKGILRYRGYPIEQLAEDATFLEVAWLLRHGELPSQQEYDKWVHDITYHTYVHENIKSFLIGFRYDAHPMSMLCSAVENFLSMVARMSEPKYEANPIFVKALEVLFILHADHEQNCSTSAVRAIGSSHVDPFSAVAGGIAALYGPLHGGANEAVLRMIQEIDNPKNVPGFIDEVKSGKGSRLMGFGHRVYKSYDPRAKIVKQLAYEIFDQVGMDKDLEIALKLEEAALNDEYFVSRKLYPNVDFYTGLIYRSMAFPTDYFTVLFAVARTAGWLAQWEEMLLDKEQKIARPRQIYVGPPERAYKGTLTNKFPRTRK
jgi:citrate synthase